MFDFTSHTMVECGGSRLGERGERFLIHSRAQKSQCCRPRYISRLGRTLSSFRLFQAYLHFPWFALRTGKMAHTINVMDEGGHWENGHGTARGAGEQEAKKQAQLLHHPPGLPERTTTTDPLRVRLFDLTMVFNVMLRISGVEVRVGVFFCCFLYFAPRCFRNSGVGNMFRAFSEPGEPCALFSWQ